jgi:5-methylcytosine-specific restriction endonuclease McrA
MATFIIRISNGKKSTYNYRGILQMHGFTFNKRSYGKSFYEREYVDDEKQVDTWVSFCEKYKLRCDVIPKEYTRSTDYRKTYFKANKPAVEARYRCAYCGRWLKYKDTTVDHIFPVNRMMYSQAVRDRAKKHGITDTNCSANLVCACRRCNSKKGTKMGLWIPRAFLGRHEEFWRAVRVSEVILLVAAGIGLYHFIGQADGLSGLLAGLFQF